MKIQISKPLDLRFLLTPGQVEFLRGLKLSDFRSFSPEAQHGGRRKINATNTNLLRTKWPRLSEAQCFTSHSVNKRQTRVTHYCLCDFQCPPLYKYFQTVRMCCNFFSLHRVPFFFYYINAKNGAFWKRLPEKSEKAVSENGNGVKAMTSSHCMWMESSSQSSSQSFWTLEQLWCWTNKISCNHLVAVL